jgi:hypothetical protein
MRHLALASFVAAALSLGACVSCAHYPAPPADARADASPPATATGDSLAHGNRTKLYGGGDAVASNSSILRNTPDNISTTGSTVLMWTFGLLSGDRPKNFSFTCVGDGLVDIATISLDIISQGDTATNLFSASATNLQSSVFTIVPVTLSSPVALGATDRLVLKLVVNAAGLSVGSVTLTYDHPTP